MRRPLVDGRRLFGAVVLLVLLVPLVLWPRVALWAVGLLALYCAVMALLWYAGGLGADRRARPPLAGRVPEPDSNVIYTTRDAERDRRSG